VETERPVTECGRIIASDGECPVGSRHRSSVAFSIAAVDVQFHVTKNEEQNSIRLSAVVGNNSGR
jgi:hypothetical protein